MRRPSLMQCAQCVSKQLVAERMRIKHWEAIRCSQQLVAESTVAYYAKQVDKNREERKAEFAMSFDFDPMSPQCFSI